jgi:type I restriction enzyme S subunit
MTKDGMVRLGSLIDEVKIRNKEQDCPVYSVTNSKGFVPSGEYFSKTVYSEELSGYKVVPYGAFAYNPSRINVGSIGYQDVAEKVAVSPLYNVFTISDAVSPRYLIGYFKSDIGLCSVRAKAHGSVRDTLRISDLGQINMPCPSMREQMHVGEVLEVLDEHREKLQRRQELFNQLAKSRFRRWAEAA